MTTETRRIVSDALAIAGTVPHVDVIAARDRLALSVPEAGVLLGISRALAYELVARGELPALRLGRRLVIPRAALVALVEDPSKHR